MENIPFIKDFIKLIENLSSVGNISLNASHNLWGTPVSGFNVTTGTCINGSSVPHEYATLLKTLYSKFSLQVADSLPYFSETEDMKVKSSSVGTACMQSSPVISFTFDGCYTTDTLSGWLQQDEKAISPAEVHNIYEEKPSNYMYLADISACRKYNPLESPMWNKEVSKKLLESRFYQSRPQSPTRLVLPSRQDNSRSQWLDIQ